MAVCTTVEENSCGVGDSLLGMDREYDKLVRDRIPEIIEADDETPITHVADDEEYARRLREKLDEEVGEYRESGRPEELADVLEVVYALGRAHDLSEDELREKRRQKATERGGFDDQVVLDGVRE
jgi:predicted house-cleaning noncanonical NTP pyrophosphatase (MazG superfamily)